MNTVWAGGRLGVELKDTLTESTNFETQFSFIGARFIDIVSNSVIQIYFQS